jgi:hypothetical protein
MKDSHTNAISPLYVTIFPFLLILLSLGRNIMLSYDASKPDASVCGPKLDS